MKEPLAEQSFKENNRTGMTYKGRDLILPQNKVLDPWWWFPEFGVQRLQKPSKHQTQGQHNIFHMRNMCQEHFRNTMNNTETT